MLFFIYKFDDTIYTGWFAGEVINEDVSRVHVFEIQAVADIVHAFAITPVLRRGGEVILIAESALFALKAHMQVV